MAVEKSYARLGLFLVVVLVVVLATATSVHSTLAEPCRHRVGHLHERKRQRAGGLEPGSLSRSVDWPRQRGPGGSA